MNNFAKPFVYVYFCEFQYKLPFVNFFILNFTNIVTSKNVHVTETKSHIELLKIHR